MKLVIAMAKEDSWPHILTEEHVHTIKEADPAIDVVVARGDEEIKTEISDADAVAGFPLRVYNLPSDAPIRWIHSFSAGVDKILTPEVMSNDSIIVSNSSGIHAIPIAEHVLGFMLMHTRQFGVSVEAQKSGTWKRPEMPGEVNGKEVLIVGMGAIGTRAAELAHALGATVRGVVRTKRDAPSFIESLHTSDELDTLLPHADFVVICLPGGAQTDGYFDTAKFTLMKPTSAIINIGRGTIINQDDLIAALNNNEIGAAYLDVTTPEPLPENDPLWTTPNVFITPHYSGLSEKYMDRAVDQLCKNLKAFAANEPLPNLVDKELGY